jgi:hypothetical protein
MTSSTKFGYFHTSTTAKPGYVTVAITRADKDAPDQRHYAALSFCSPKDVFSKVKGRMIAENRLNAKKHVIEVSLAGSIPEVVKAVMQKVIDDKLVPSWVIKAHKRNRLNYGLNRNIESPGFESLSILNSPFDFNNAMAMFAQMFGGTDQSGNYCSDTETSNPSGCHSGGCCGKDTCSSNCG